MYEMEEKGFASKLIESKHPIRRVAPIGVRLPLAVGASSKVLVAFAEPSMNEFILKDPAWQVLWIRKSIAVSLKS